MTSRRLTWLTTLLSTGALFGCGDDSSGDAGPTVEELPVLFSESLCATLEGCGPLFDAQFGDTCVAQTTSDLENGSFVHIPAAIEAGTLVYDGSRVGACLDAIGEIGCGLFSGARIPEVCNEAIDGQVAVGDDCSIDEECQGTAHCGGTDSCPGTCTDAGTDGAACEDDDDCEAGLLCHAAECTPPRAHGDACGGELPGCGADLFCVGEDGETGEPGTCADNGDVFSGASGDACNFGTGEFCAEGLVCLISLEEGAMELSQVCGARAGSGEACQLAFPGHCPNGEHCAGVDPDGGSFDGTCEALPGDGLACATSGFTQCARGRACVDGTCRTVRDNGGSCGDDAECFSHNCDGGSCAAPDACDYSSAG